MNLETKRSFAALFYTLSGATGLIYQIIWFKYLGLFLGNTTYAQMVVLVAFLGGLAIGNFIFGRIADKFKNPVVIYGILELVIGAYCLLYHWLTSNVSELFFSTVQNLDAAPDSTIVLVMKFFVSASLLIIPTIAMGGTFPTISRFFVEDDSQTRKATATLYFLNSFGAVWGILLVGFFLIPTFGLKDTLVPAAIVNLAIGIFALFIKHDFKKPVEVDVPESTSLETKKYPKKNILLIIVIAGLSGFAALSYEMLWTRLLINIFGSSTYAFSLMLMAFISGIALGSFIISLKYFSRFDKLNLIIISQALIAVGILIALPIFDRLPYFLWQLGSLFNKSATTFTIFLILEFLICFALMFIPTIFMGMSLPLIVEVVNTGKDEISNSIGKVFAVNTIGTVLGVIFTALVFIPMFGVRGTFEIGIALNLFSALLLLFMSDNISGFKKYLFGGVAAIFLIFHYVALENFDANISVSGVFRYFSREAPKTFDEFSALMSGRKILMYKEGVNANVAILETGEKEKIITLVINGKADASTGIDMTTQIMSAQIPMMLHKNPKQVCVIGMGSGVTVGSVLSHDVESVDCLEITKEVIDAAKYFHVQNENCLEDKRLKVTIDDALSYFKSTNKKYDVIISEPSNPWIAGIGNLFTVEFLQNCKEKLNDDGLMVQWFHAYESSDQLLSIVLNSVGHVFPNAYLFVGSGNDFLIVASKKELKIDESELVRRFEQEKVKRNLERAYVKNLFTFLSTQMLTPKIFASLTDDELLNSELKPILEFFAPRSLFIKDNAKFVKDYDQRISHNKNELFISSSSFTKNISEQDMYDALLYHYKAAANSRLVYALATEFLKKEFSLRIKSLQIKAGNEIGIVEPMFSLNELDSVSYADAKSFLIDKSLLAKSSASSFLGFNSLQGEFEYLSNSVNKDTLKYLQISILATKMFYENGELELAQMYAERVQNILNNSPGWGEIMDSRTYAKFAVLTYLELKNYRKAIEYSMAFIGLSDDQTEKNRLMKRLNLELDFE